MAPKGRPKKKSTKKRRQDDDDDDQEDMMKKKKPNPSSRLKSSFKRFIYKLSNRIDHELSFSQKAMSIMNSIVQDYFEKIAIEAMKICEYQGTQTITTRAIAAATRLIFPPGLSAEALQRAEKAHTISKKDTKSRK